MPRIEWLYTPMPWIIAGAMLTTRLWNGLLGIDDATAVNAGLACVWIGICLAFVRMTVRRWLRPK